MMVFVYFLLHIPPRPSTMTLKQKMEQLNLWGLVALIPGVICLCLALQWGGFTYKVCFSTRIWLQRFNFISTFKTDIV
jgi:hypothetical protein